MTVLNTESPNDHCLLTAPSRGGKAQEVSSRGVWAASGPMHLEQTRFRTVLVFQCTGTPFCVKAVEPGSLAISPIGAHPAEGEFVSGGLAPRGGSVTLGGSTGLGVRCWARVHERSPGGSLRAHGVPRGAAGSRLPLGQHARWRVACSPHVSSALGPFGCSLTHKKWAFCTDLNTKSVSIVSSLQEKRTLRLDTHTPERRHGMLPPSWREEATSECFSSPVFLPLFVLSSRRPYRVTLAHLVDIFCS